jgi:hypothetical protein
MSSVKRRKQDPPNGLTDWLDLDLNVNAMQTMMMSTIIDHNWLGTYSPVGSRQGNLERQVATVGTVVVVRFFVRFVSYVSGTHSGHQQAQRQHDMMSATVKA